MKRVPPIPMSTVLGALLIAGSFAACGKTDPKPPPKVEDTVFRDMAAAKEKARVDAEKAMAVNSQKLEEAMKKNEAGTQ